MNQAQDSSAPRRLDWCECSDPGCPAHLGLSSCAREGADILYRIDMEDETGTAMCEACAADAFESGVFYAE